MTKVVESVLRPRDEEAGAVHLFDFPMIRNAPDPVDLLYFISISFLEWFN
jgi:hypothetical protein